MASVSAVHDGTMQLMKVLPLGGTIKAVDTTRMTKAYDQVFADLKKSGLDSWATAGTIPDDIVPHLEALMAFDAMSSYHVSEKTATSIVNKASQAMREIRRLSVPDYESLEEPTDF